MSNGRIAVVTRARPLRLGGRPSQREAARLGERIVAAATYLFLRLGYSATSVEAVARRARISKRTFYHRFSDKTVLFGAVVRHVVERLRPPADVPLVQGRNAREKLTHIARIMLRGALSPQALALHRMIVAESAHFPKLAAVVTSQGATEEGIGLIADILEQEIERGRCKIADRKFAAEQFIHMVIAVPQRRAIGLGRPMGSQEIDEWPARVVDLFLHGCRCK